MIKKTKDVLIVARPDHSLQIYNALVNQTNLDFIYLTYKVVPHWIKRIIKNKKLTGVSRNALISWRLTIVDLCMYKWQFQFAKKWNELTILDRPLRKLFRKNEFKLIHYWPEYGNGEIRKYYEIYSNCFLIADIHMPHPGSVFESMKPTYEKYGIDPQTTSLAQIVSTQRDLIDNESTILAPSSYVAETYKRFFPDNKYVIESYGITASKGYSKRYKDVVKNFVYVGRVSIEKGCDLLFEYFKHHQQYNLHIYGTVLDSQKFIFDRYKGYSNNIIMHGHVAKVELQEHLKEHDAGIHVSRFDAYSLAVGEIIGCGLPVIVSENTGNKDDVKNEGFGEVTTLDLEGIDRAVRRITTPHIYNQYSDNIEHYINNRHRPYGERIVSFYESILFSNR